MAMGLPKRRVGVAAAGWCREDVGLPGRGAPSWRGLRPRPAGRAILLRTRSVHTFGMRERLRVVTLDRNGVVLSNRVVGPRRLVWEPTASWILELDADDPGPDVGSALSLLASGP